MAGRIVASGKPMRIPVVDREEVAAAMKPEHRPWLDRYCFHSVLGVPLRDRAKIIGAVMVSRNRTSSSYTIEDERLLEALADRAGLAIGNARLIAAVRVAYEEGQRLIDELARTVRANELFAGVLGHDLRGPLSAISYAATALMCGAETDVVRRPTQRILSASERMARMIDQLLDLTRIRSGDGIRLSTGVVDLGAATRRLLDELRDAWPDREIVAELHGDLVGTWDMDRLGQVIANLANNAIEHGRGAHIHVRLDGTDPTAVALQIRNAGEIAPDIRPVLFDPFRKSRAPDHGQRGLGLGLFICQEIVHAPGGSIELSTAAGTTTAMVRLPRNATRDQ
jgi:signal transduction histidine kinase